MEHGVLGRNAPCGYELVSTSSVRRHTLAMCGAVAGVALAGVMGSTAARAGAEPETITLAVWASLPAEAVAMNQTIAAFTQATGIRVKKETIGDQYMDVLRSRFAAHRTPDVFMLNSSDAPILIKSGVLEPFDGRINNPDDFFPQFLDAFKGEDGKVYGLPKDFSTLALYINTRLLAKAGFQPSDIPADHAGLIAFAKRLQTKLPKGVGAMIYEKDLARHLAALETFGQPVITEDQASLSGNLGVINYLTTYTQGRKEGYLYSPKDDLGADSPGAAFGSGKTVLMLEGNWVLGSLRLDYPDVPFLTREMPTVNGRRQTMAFVVGLSVSKYSKNKEGGFKFAQFMTQAGMKDWAERSGTLPTRKSVLTAMNIGADPVLAAHTRGAAYATVWSRGTSLPIVNNNFGNQFLAALNGSKPVQEAMQKAEQASNREIERQK